MCKNIISDYQNVIKCIVMGVEAWIYACSPETADQSIEYCDRWTETKKTTPKQVENQGGGVHYEFFSPRQTVNKKYYLRVMLCLREAIRLEMSELWADNSWFVHYDNVLLHPALLLCNSTRSSTTALFAWFRSVGLLAISETKKKRFIDIVLTLLRRLKSNWRGLWRQFRNSTLTAVSKIGKHVGISEL